MKDGVEGEEVSNLGGPGREAKATGYPIMKLWPHQHVLRSVHMLQADRRAASNISSTYVERWDKGGEGRGGDGLHCGESEHTPGIERWVFCHVIVR